MVLQALHAIHVGDFAAAREKLTAADTAATSTMGMADCRLAVKSRTPPANLTTVFLGKLSSAPAEGVTLRSQVSIRS